MTYNPNAITGVLRRWRRSGKDAVTGYVYESDIWEDGDRAHLYPGAFIESANFFLFNMGAQVYKLPKEEEIKDGSGDVSPSSN